MTAQPAAPILDGLGVTLDLDDGDLVANAIVLAKVVGSDGQVGLVISDDTTTTWLDQLALVTAAQDILRSGQFTERDDD